MTLHAFKQYFYPLWTYCISNVFTAAFCQRLLKNMMMIMLLLLKATEHTLWMPSMC